MSNLCKFKVVSDAKMRELEKNKLKKCTFAKMQWAVRAYKDWRNNILADPVTYDYRIYKSDIEITDKLHKQNFEFSMCKFIGEVTKIKDGSGYPGRTLYQMCVSIQKHLNERGINWKIIEGNNFKKLRTVLDNMKERAANNI